MTTNAILPPVEAGSAGQLAFELFAEFPEAISTASRDIGFQKPQSFLQVTQLSLLARKAINAAHFVVSDTTQRPDGTFAVDQGYFVWLANFNSKNTAYLRKAMTEAQGALIQALVLDATNQKRDAWTSVPLIGRVTIANGQVVFSIDPAIVSMLKKKDASAFLSLRISSCFDRKHSLELYEKLLAYRPFGETPWISVSDIGKWVSLKSDEKEFKYINRDVLDPAMKEINKMSDIFVELEKRNVPGSRKIAEFRFKIRDNPDGLMVVGSSHRKDLKEIYEILTEEFGLSDKQIDDIREIAENGGIERIRSAIDYTRVRIAEGKKRNDPISIPARYFMRALDSGWRVPKALKEEGKPAVDLAKQSSEKMVDAEKTKSSDIVAVFLSSAENDPAAAEEIWAAFAKSPGGKAIIKKHGVEGGYREALENEALHLPFGGYLSQQEKKKATKKAAEKKEA